MASVPHDNIPRRQRLAQSLRRSIDNDDKNQITLIIDQLQDATHRGDRQHINLIFKKLESTKGRAAVNPTVNADGIRLTTYQEQVDFWGEYVEGKYEEVTDAELSREDFFDRLCPVSSEENPDGRDPFFLMPTDEEIEKTCKRLKLGKATGCDQLPAEVFKWSPTARKHLGVLVKAMWVQV